MVSGLVECMSPAALHNQTGSTQMDVIHMAASRGITVLVEKLCEVIERRTTRAALVMMLNAQSANGRGAVDHALKCNTSLRFH